MTQNHKQEATGRKKTPPAEEGHKKVKWVRSKEDFEFVAEEEGRVTPTSDCSHSCLNLISHYYLICCPPALKYYTLVTICSHFDYHRCKSKSPARPHKVLSASTAANNNARNLSCKESFSKVFFIIIAALVSIFSSTNGCR